jgi:hypothetical protein
LKFLATALIDFPFPDEFPGPFLLVEAHFLWPAEDHAARLGGQSAVTRSETAKPNVLPFILRRRADPRRSVERSKV